MRVEIKENIRFKQNYKSDPVCSIIHNGKYIFNPIEARKLGYIKETEKYKTKCIYYNDNRELAKAIQEMPDYKCWDSSNKVLIK